MFRTVRYVCSKSGAPEFELGKDGLAKHTGKGHHMLEFNLTDPPEGDPPEPPEAPNFKAIKDPKRRAQAEDNHVRALLEHAGLMAEHRFLEIHSQPAPDLKCGVCGAPMEEA